MIKPIQGMVAILRVNYVESQGLKDAGILPGIRYSIIERTDGLYLKDYDIRIFGTSSDPYRSITGYGMHFDYYSDKKNFPKEQI